jgi:hypothetical protein
LKKDFPFHKAANPPALYSRYHVLAVLLTLLASFLPDVKDIAETFED